MKRKGRKVWLPVLLIMAMVVTMLPLAEVTKAATSYTNAKDFYESTAVYGNPYHAEMINGTIYYATKAKKASSSSNLKYRTIGFDIQLSGNGHTVLFTVQRSGGSMRQIDSRSTDTHVYNLYAVEDDMLFELATKADSVKAAYVLGAEIIKVRMDAILTTRKGDKVYGSIEEDGKGGFTKDGTIYRLKDSTVYAGYDEKLYTITFDKQGGYGGSDSVSATYGELLPPADAPSRDGYTFKGYYTGKNRTGDRFYNEHMASEYVYKKDGNTMVYAAWEDETVPEVVLNVSCEKWTNQPVTLTANARDMGSGLSSVQIYRIGTEGALQLVAEAKGLNGVHSKAITFENETEGVVRYKAVATDMEGHTAESYGVVYYDITPPSGEVIKVEINGTTFYFEIDITDVNPGD